MQEPIKALLNQGTIGAIFLAVLLIAVVLFAGWAKKLIAEQLSQKDSRITQLESDVKELQVFCRHELITLISETQKTIQKNTDTFNRMENILDKINL
jgi:peptidoglycan hydrolase CwlO-like protein